MWGDLEPPKPASSPGVPFWRRQTRPERAPKGLADLIQAETKAERRLAVATQRRGAGSALFGLARPASSGACAYRSRSGFSPMSQMFPAASPIEFGRMFRNWRWIFAITRLATRSRSWFVTVFGVVILGAPNAGKSSLLKCAGWPRSSNRDWIPWTTRDIVQVTLDLGGHRVAGQRYCRSSGGVKDAVETHRDCQSPRRARRMRTCFLLLSDGVLPYPSVSGYKPQLRVRSKIDVAPIREGRRI